MKVKKQRIIFGYIVLDLFLLLVSALSVLFLPYVLELVESPPVSNKRALLMIAVYGVGWLITIFANNAQDIYMRTELLKRNKALIINCFVFAGIAATIILVLGLKYHFLKLTLFVTGTFLVLNMISFKILIDIFKESKFLNSFGARMLVVGAGEKGREVLKFVNQNKHLGYNVVGFLDDFYTASNGLNLLGKVNDLDTILEEKKVDEIVITLPIENDHQIRTAIQSADTHGIRVNLIPEFPYETKGNYKSYSLGTLPVLQYRQIPLDLFHNFILKKAFDYLFATAVIILLFPVFAMIAILIKMDSPGPILYKPIRKGQLGQNFVCFKFRTMKQNDDANAGTQSTVKDDPRITRVGRFLRKFDLDELPQFLNVIKGDMSVVGPRPHRVNLNNDFRKVVSDYMIRHYVKPGLTGWAQVNGWRGPTETEEQKRERVSHDLWYINNWSIWLDIKIVFLTVFSRKSRVNAF
ncbi:MAG: undecaprenyl-phosphate glucose phosphotransferase [Bacteroidetes bacterium]|nr:undecaprenyl-phosphate glucose phosphotransferase [Bacteroidota bacterium]MCB0842269.1 undecaprenyl-phosphate glucose phosphotransferase [Bacteroidota bacterium]MCB0851080.1 undecaprenyl-phosphate glucose phosphotransferase [Bacteroidota bacterium]